MMLEKLIYIIINTYTCIRYRKHYFTSSFSPVLNGRYKPDGADYSLLCDLPAECSGEQPDHRSTGEEPAHADRYQPLPALFSC